VSRMTDLTLRSESMSEKVKPKLVGPKVAAEHIGIACRTFRHGVSKGFFPYYQFGGTKLFKLEEIEAAFQTFRVVSKS
jgi:hypothetical protein